MGSIFLPLLWKIINFVLEVLRAILLALNHSAIFCISVLNLWTRVGRLGPESRQVVSSAKRIERRRVAFGRSLIKQRKRTGPREVPRITEISKLLGSDRVPFMSTICFWSER